MKAHKYWSIGALITMLGTFYTGYKLSLIHICWVKQKVYARYV